jgi:hypothetical protein
MRDDTTDPCSEDRTLIRPRYFDGQLLTTEDFTTEQSYLMDKLRAHNRLLHGDGTVCGLAVAPTTPPSGSVIVEPGVALDCCGREIVVTEPIEVDLHDLADESADPHRVYLCLRYGEVERDPSPVPPPTPVGEPQPTRIHEIARVDVTTERPQEPDRSEPADRAAPCPPCPDERVLLATVTVPRSGRIDRDDIDASTRPIVGSSSRLDPASSGGSRRCRVAVPAGVAAALAGWWIARRRR